MPRKPRQFEFDKPIDVAACYTRAVSMPVKELWRVKNIILNLNKKYRVRVLHYMYNEKCIHLRLLFEANCGCTLSEVMRWFFTKVAKSVNAVFKTHGKVFTTDSNRLF